MKVSYDSGISIENDAFKFIIDSSRKISNKEAIVGISHAHSDHTKKHDTNLILTQPTKQLSFLDSGKFKPLDYNEKLKFDETTVSLHDANHILGSAQFKIDDGSESIVYTGDFRAEKGFLFDGCEMLKCDKLIVESTYGLPEYKFPNPFEVMVEVKRWLRENENKNVMFGAYSTGKAQEVVWMLNQLDVTPIVHPYIHRVCKIYEENGVKLGQYVSSDSDEGHELMKNAFVGVVSPWLLKQHFFEGLNAQNNRRVVSAFVTGWNFNRFRVDKLFHLSDHADFPQLIDYIKQSNAKQVYTVHGYDKQLARYISKKLGISARPLPGKQTRLFDF